MLKGKTKDMIVCAMFVALIAAGAFIRIPIPMVPLTLQILFTMMAGLLLGGRRGALAVLVYMFMGLLGLPIFTGGGGIAYVLKPTFGYIIGFAAGAYVTGELAQRIERPGFVRLFVACISGLCIVYIIGTAYFYMISSLYLGETMDLRTLLITCVLTALPGDILKCFIAAVLAKRLIPVMRKNRM